MAVEFEQLRSSITQLGATAAERQVSASAAIEQLLNTLRTHATEWAAIDAALQWALAHVDKQKLRAAQPLFDDEPLDTGIDPDPAPAQATLIAIDGSQTRPTRHDAYMYFLLNIGGLIYPHGQSRAPETFSVPTLHYLGDGVVDNVAAFAGSAINIRRDMQEIDTLANRVWQNRYAAAPVVAILDQRLQYWPIGSQDSARNEQYVQTWLEGMENIKRCNAWLAGYIERPETASVIALLQALRRDEADFDPTVLVERTGLTDALLFRRVLGRGQRSAVFAVVNESTNYAPFREAGQEICFFYFNPPGAGDITRVDVPLWAAQQPEVIAQLHALLYDQCTLLGNYPYILTRADEIAVVQRSDQEYLDHLVELELQRHGVNATITGKQFGKELSRAGKTRF